MKWLIYNRKSQNSRLYQKKEKKSQNSREKKSPNIFDL